MPLTVHAERCIHQRITHSNCQSCVDACPHAAWTHDEDGLSLSTDACDGCGHCVAACPHEALSIPEPAPHVVDAPTRSLALACARVDSSARPDSVGTISCLHALSPHWLIQQTQRHQCKRVLLASADCNACSRAPRTLSLEQRWKPIAQRLGTVAPELLRIAPQRWHELSAQTQAPDMARRRLFGRLLAPRPTTQLPATGTNAAAMSSQRSAVVAHFARQSQGSASVPLWAIAIDPVRCTACMVCVTLCPQQALEHHPVKPGTVETDCIELPPGRCTGCGLCTEVCEHDAITLHGAESAASAAARAPSVPLTSLVCGQCKAPFYRPTAQINARHPGQRPICPVCSAGKPLHTQRVVQDFDATAAPPTA